MASYKYFEYFPFVRYILEYWNKKPEAKDTYNGLSDWILNSETELKMTHILRRIRFSKQMRKMSGYWQDYRVYDGESPLTVALKHYGSEELFWVILLYNDIFDPFTQWVMTQDELEEYINLKYDDPNAVHHYELDDHIVPTPIDNKGQTLGMHQDDRGNITISKRKEPVSDSVPEDSFKAEKHTVTVIGGDNDDDFYRPRAVSNRLYEFWVNEAKRHIKIPPARFIEGICAEANKLLNK